MTFWAYDCPVGFDSDELGEGEDLVWEMRPHWWVLMGRLAVAVAVVLGGAAADLLYPNMPTWALGALGVLAVLALVRFFVRWAAWAGTRYVLTTDRIVVRWGVLSRQGREIPLQRVADIGFRQSAWERILHIGTVRIEPVGGRNVEMLAKVRSPGKVQRAIWGQIERGGRRSQLGTLPGLSIPEQIEKLDELRRRGVISDTEFDLKRNDLLDRL